MGVRIERPGSSAACVVHIDGDMDMSVVPAIRSAVDAAVDLGCTCVVLDLSGVTYADSSALGLIVWMDRRLQPLDGRLVLAGADRNVNRVLELSGLVGLAPSVVMASDTEQALGTLELVPERSGPSWEERLVVAAEVASMSGVRRRVCDLVAPLGLTEGAVFDLKVAVGEALANAVRHGSPGGSGDAVQVTVSAYDDRVVVTVQDAGGGFDGDPLSGDDVYASGGRGVMFMRALMDRVEFSRCDDGGTVVRLTKRLAAGSDRVVTGA
ncbi:MAG: anti-sigma factor antagonist [Coriobacteriia bacterium]|nr:anti-sigma factor antagonist [Coriobacteriia bacterium]